MSQVRLEPATCRWGVTFPALRRMTASLFQWAPFFPGNQITLFINKNTEFIHRKVKHLNGEKLEKSRICTRKLFSQKLHIKKSIMKLYNFDFKVVKDLGIATANKWPSNETFA